MNAQQHLDELWARGNQAWEDGDHQGAIDIIYRGAHEYQGGADFYLALFALTSSPEYLLAAAEHCATIGQQSSLLPAYELVWYRPSLSQGEVITTPGDLIRARDLWQGAASPELDDYDHEILNDLTRATLALYQGDFRRVLAIVEGLNISGFRSDIDFLLGAALIGSDLSEPGIEFISRAQELGLGPEAQELGEQLLAAAEHGQEIDFQQMIAADRQRQEFNRVISGFYSAVSEESAADIGE